VEVTEHVNQPLDVVGREGVEAADYLVDEDRGAAVRLLVDSAKLLQSLIA
jgi:hypothetical protein